MGTLPGVADFGFVLGLALDLGFKAASRFFGVRFFAVLLEDAARVMFGIVSWGYKVVKSGRFWLQKQRTYNSFPAGDRKHNIIVFIKLHS
jgi:hypothetical protein